MALRPDSSRSTAAPSPGRPAVEVAPYQDPDQNYAGHYLHATPSPVPGIVGLLMALALMSFGISELRTSAGKQASIQVAAAGDTITRGAVVLVVMAEGWTLDGQPVQETDLLFRLTGAAGRSPVIIVEHTTGLPASRLASALELVNQAGFTQVGVRPTPASSSPAPAASE